LWNISRGARVQGGGFGWSGRQPLSGKARATLSTPRTTREIAKSHQRNPAPHTGVLSSANPARTEMIAKMTVTALDPDSPRVNKAVKPSTIHITPIMTVTKRARNAADSWREANA